MFETLSLLKLKAICEPCIKKVEAAYGYVEKAKSVQASLIDTAGRSKSTTTTTAATCLTENSFYKRRYIYIFV